MLRGEPSGEQFVIALFVAPVFEELGGEVGAMADFGLPNPFASAAHGGGVVGEWSEKLLLNQIAWRAIG